MQREMPSDAIAALQLGADATMQAGRVLRDRPHRDTVTAYRVCTVAEQLLSSLDGAVSATQDQLACVSRQADLRSDTGQDPALQLAEGSSQLAVARRYLRQAMEALDRGRGEVGWVAAGHE